MRYLDFISPAGAVAPAGEHTNVRADFSMSGATGGALLASWTMQDNASFDANFRLAKSTDAQDQCQVRGVDVACVVLPAHGAVEASAGSTVVVPLVAQTKSFASEILVYSLGGSAASSPRSIVNLRAALGQPDECAGWKRVKWSEAQVWLPTRGIEVGLGGIGSESAADRALEFVDISWGALTTSGDHGRFIEAGGRRCRRILDPRTGWPVGRWRSGSVAAPLCTVAGSCAKIAMLVERDAPSLLAAQGVAWLGIDASGARRGTLAAKP